MFVIAATEMPMSLDGGILTVKTMNENGGVEIRDNRDGSVYAITPRGQSRRRRCMEL